jgi:tRNA pseudouridine55 synthase
MTSGETSGVVVVDKTRGPTSHDVVARVRKTLGVRAVGHAGTLDPMATGVLVLAVREATKLVPWLTAQDKSYVATVSLGVETDSLDADGRDVALAPPGEQVLAALERAQTGATAPLLENALELERRRHRQIPPAFSAIKSGGVRSFTRARRGSSTELAARDVLVRRLVLVGCSPDPPSITISLDVAKGYYVRALARDLAAALGTVGHLTALRRLRSGPFTLEEALPIDSSAERIRASLVPLAEAAARALPVVRLSSAGARDARHGRTVPASRHDAGARPGPAAWLDPDGALLAIGEIDADGNGTVLRGFAAP